GPWRALTCRTPAARGAERPASTSRSRRTTAPAATTATTTGPAGRGDPGRAPRAARASRTPRSPRALASDPQSGRRVTAAKRGALAASLAGFGIWGGLAPAHDPPGTAATPTPGAPPAAPGDSSTAPGPH